MCLWSNQKLVADNWEGSAQSQKSKNPVYAVWLNSMVIAAFVQSNVRPAKAESLSSMISSWSISNMDLMKVKTSGKVLILVDV